MTDFDSSRPSLKMVTLNLGFNVMANKVKGSEGPLVQRCQLQYPETGGWSESNKISQCSANAVDLLADYDLICLQEANPKHWRTFENKLFSSGQLKGRQYASFYDPRLLLAVVYDQPLLGSGVLLTAPGCLWGDCEKKLPDSRGLQVLYFSRWNLAVGNLHAPHGIQLKPSLEMAFKELTIPIGVRIERMLLAGDFNDYKGQLLKDDVTVNVWNQRLRVLLKASPTSCCYDTGYQHPGDYILDSLQGSLGVLSYGIPDGYNRDLLPMSDHDPVAASLIL